MAMRLFTSLLLLFFTTYSLFGQMGQGEFIPGALSHEDSLRTYIVYVPSGYDGSEAWPLVINMHGAGSNSQAQIFLTQMELVADTANFLVVYPQGTFSPVFNGGLWNDLLDPTRVNDVAFLSRLIDQLALDYKIDPAKVYAAGFSNGGAMSHFLACRLPDRIAAVASVAGPVLDPLYQEYCQLDRPVPILHMHGSADPIVPITGGTDVNGTFDSPDIDDYIQFWVNQNNCTGEPQIVNVPDTNTADNSTVEIRKYENCDAGTEVYYYLINNGSHLWPGGPDLPPGFEFLGTNLNRDIHASVEIWNFFNQHEHPAPASVPQLLQKTIMVDALEREYLLYVPAAYDGSENWPLVFNLHGARSSAGEQMFISGINAVADTGHFLVAYPQGLLNPGGNIGWNEPGLPTFQDDVQFIGELIDEIANDYSIDLSRVYATGLSNGGGMCYTLACGLSDKLAAIAAVASPGNTPCSPDKPVPVLVMHGTADLIAPFEGGVGVASPIDFPASRDRLQFRLDNNGCTNDSTVVEFPDINTADNSTVILEKYSNCEDESEVWFYQINNGGHTWPGGPPVPPGFEVLGNVNRDINASIEIWNFFNRHVLSNEPSAVRFLDAAEIGLRVFPNPFVSDLAFAFVLPDVSRVQLNLFNALGQPVAYIADRQFPAGNHRLEWQAGAADLAPGLYFYRMQIGDRWLSRAVVFGR